MVYTYAVRELELACYCVILDQCGCLEADVHSIDVSTW